MREVSIYFEQRSARRNNEWQAVILWLNKADDPGPGTLSGLAAHPSPRLIAVDLVELLGRLDDKDLALNVLRPLTVERETQVRQDFLKWVQNIQGAPDLEAETEQRLVTVLTQLIEQKFKVLTYKELSEMLRLTPLRERTSVQELLQDHTIELLTKLIRHKFRFADRTIERLTGRLQQLALKDLEDLVGDILDMKTLAEINAWIDARLSKPATGHRMDQQS